MHTLPHLQPSASLGGSSPSSSSLPPPHTRLPPLRPLFGEDGPLSHLFEAERCEECAAMRVKLRQLQTEREAEAKVEAEARREAAARAESGGRKRKREAEGGEAEARRWQSWRSQLWCGLRAKRQSQRRRRRRRRQRKTRLIWEAKRQPAKRRTRRAHRRRSQQQQQRSQQQRRHRLGSPRTPLQIEIAAFSARYDAHRAAAHPPISAAPLAAVGAAVAAVDLRRLTRAERACIEPVGRACRGRVGGAL